MENHSYDIRWPPLSITILITQVRNYVIGATPMSCETQLTTVINNRAKILNNKGQVDTFMLDFETTLLNSLKVNCSAME